MVEDSPKILAREENKTKQNKTPPMQGTGSRKAPVRKVVSSGRKTRIITRMLRFKEVTIASSNDLPWFAQTRSSPSIPTEKKKKEDCYYCNQTLINAPVHKDFFIIIKRERGGWGGNYCSALRKRTLYDFFPRETTRSRFMEMRLWGRSGQIYLHSSFFCGKFF